MHNFREAYKNAVNELPGFRLEACRVQDELHHHRMTAARRKKTFISAAAAVCVFLICGAGTIAAVSYRGSEVKIFNNGFSFTNQTDCEEKCDLSRAAAGESVLAGGAETAAAAAYPGETPSDRAVDGRNAKNAMGGALEPVELEAVPIETREYDTVEEFLAGEDIVIAIPPADWLGEEENLDWQKVVVADAMNMVNVSYSFKDDSFFSMHQDDNRGTRGYASSSTYMGEAVNERDFINEQGIQYTLFDSEEDGKIVSTHAAVCVNGRDITLDFFEYDVETVEKVLYQLDLSIYFTE